MTAREQQTLRSGYWVALTLKPDAAPLRSYVGKIEEVDDKGVRITLIDWIVGMATNWDFFAPWDSITSALVATPDHDVKGFAEAAGKWQTQSAP